MVISYGNSGDACKASAMASKVMASVCLSFIVSYGFYNYTVLDFIGFIGSKKEKLPTPNAESYRRDDQCELKNPLRVFYPWDCSGYLNVLSNSWRPTSLTSLLNKLIYVSLSFRVIGKVQWNIR